MELTFQWVDLIKIGLPLIGLTIAITFGLLKFIDNRNKNMTEMGNKFSLLIDNHMTSNNRLLEKLIQQSQEEHARQGEMHSKEIAILEVIVNRINGKG